MEACDLLRMEFLAIRAKRGFPSGMTNKDEIANKDQRWDDKQRWHDK
jgi:hypothetical protein